MSKPAYVYEMSANVAGMRAREHDDETGQLTDNPYTEGTSGHYWWYRGYNYDEENPESTQFIREYNASTHITPTPEV